MAKKNWGKPAYKGKPEPTKAAKRFMMVLIIILLAGFIKAGIKNNWFGPIIDFIIS